MFERCERMLYVSTPYEFLRKLYSSFVIGKGGGSGGSRGGGGVQTIKKIYVSIYCRFEINKHL